MALTMVAMKITTFWDVTLCSLADTYSIFRISDIQEGGHEVGVRAKQKGRSAKWMESCDPEKGWNFRQEEIQNVMMVKKVYNK